MASQKTTITFWNGHKMPLVGLGTWQSSSDDVKLAVQWALEAGYRHFDTAYAYTNEAAIGEVFQEWIQSGRIKREDLFITTKLPSIGNHADKVEHFMQKSLENLKTDYVDLYLIHIPVGMIGKHDTDLQPKDDSGKPAYDMNTDIVQVWKAMENQVDAGRARSIGISNFNSQQIEKIVKNARIMPANLQVELSAYFQQKRLREVCKKYGITVVGYGSLGSPGRAVFYARFGKKAEIPPVLSDPVVLEIAKAHSKTPAQVLLRHLIQQDIVVIPKSVTQKRVQENFQVFDFELSSSEMDQLNGLDKDARSTWMDINPGARDHPEYPFNIPY